GSQMNVQLNHTIVWCSDQQKSVAFLRDILELPEAIAFGPMRIVKFGNQVSLDFYQQDGEISPQHYAFLVAEEDFDKVFARIRARGLQYWADPARKQAGEIYRYNGGR